MKLDNISVLTCKALMSTTFIKNMLEYDRIDLSEGIDVEKNISTSKKCYLCGYWYFIKKKLIIKNICVMVVMIYLQKLLVCIIYV